DSTGAALLSFLPSPQGVSVDFAFSFFMPFTRFESCPEFMASWIWTLRCRQSLIGEQVVVRSSIEGEPVIVFLPSVVVQEGFLWSFETISSIT
ncbi:hypothetical protein Tco_1095977, partial [Tanacetum coccineum]